VTRDFICRNGFKQNLDSDFSQSKTQYQYVRQGKFRPHNRYFSKDLFKTTLIKMVKHAKETILVIQLVLVKYTASHVICLEIHYIFNVSDFQTGSIRIKSILMKIQPCIKLVHLK